MSDNSVLFSYCLLGGVGIYGCAHTTSLTWSHGCFGLITINSVTWILRYASDSLNNQLHRFQDLSSFCQLIFALPCLTTGVWLGLGYRQELAWAHTGVSLIPLICYIADRNIDRGFIDLILAVNSVSLGVVSYLADDFWGIATAVVYGCTHFMFYDDYSQDKDVYNYMLSLFAFLAGGPI